MLPLFLPDGGDRLFCPSIRFKQLEKIVMACRSIFHKVIDEPEPQGTHTHDIGRPMPLQFPCPARIAQRFYLWMTRLVRIIENDLLHDPVRKRFLQDPALPYSLHHTGGKAGICVKKKTELVPCFIIGRSSMKPPPGKLSCLFSQHRAHDGMGQQKIYGPIHLGTGRPRYLEPAGPPRCVCPAFQKIVRKRGRYGRRKAAFSRSTCTQKNNQHQ